MRTPILILSLSIVSLCFSQDFISFDHKKELDWSLYEDTAISEVFLETHFEELKYPYFEFAELLENRQSYHLLDIDGDGSNELVYNGWNGAEGEMVNIYQLYSDSCILQQQFFGKIIDILITDSLISTLKILDYACCAGYVDHIETFSFDLDSGKFTMINSLAMVTGTEIPTTILDSFIRFEIENELYKLRLSPNIEKLSSELLDFDPIEGENTIAVYSKGARGTAYASSMDSTGRVWWFVVMDKPTSNEQNLFYEGNNPFNVYQAVGWMSSRYLKRIN